MARNVAYAQEEGKPQPPPARYPTTGKPWPKGVPLITAGHVVVGEGEIQKVSVTPQEAELSREIGKSLKAGKPAGVAAAFQQFGRPTPAPGIQTIDRQIQVISTGGRRTSPDKGSFRTIYEKADIAHGGILPFGTTPDEYAEKLNIEAAEAREYVGEEKPDKRAWYEKGYKEAFKHSLGQVLFPILKPSDVREVWKGTTKAERAARQKLTGLTLFVEDDKIIGGRSAFQTLTEEGALKAEEEFKEIVKTDTPYYSGESVAEIKREEQRKVIGKIASYWGVGRLGGSLFKKVGQKYGSRTGSLISGGTGVSLIAGEVTYKTVTTDLTVGEAAKETLFELIVDPGTYAFGIGFAQAYKLTPAEILKHPEIKQTKPTRLDITTYATEGDRFVSLAKYKNFPERFDTPLLERGMWGKPKVSEFVQYKTITRAGASEGEASSAVTSYLKTQTRTYDLQKTLIGRTRSFFTDKTTLIKETRTEGRVGGVSEDLLGFTFAGSMLGKTKPRIISQTRTANILADLSARKIGKVQARSEVIRKRDIGRWEINKKTGKKEFIKEGTQRIGAGETILGRFFGFSDVQYPKGFLDIESGTFLLHSSRFRDIFKKRGFKGIRSDYGDYKTSLLFDEKGLLRGQKYPTSLKVTGVWREWRSPQIKEIKTDIKLAIKSKKGQQLKPSQRLELRDYPALEPIAVKEPIIESISKIDAPRATLFELPLRKQRLAQVSGLALKRGLRREQQQKYISIFTEEGRSLISERLAIQSLTRLKISQRLITTEDITTDEIITVPTTKTKMGRLPTGVLIPFIPRGGPIFPGKKKRKKIKQKKKYAPSLAAAVLKIESPIPKKLTGLEIRPLRPAKKRKKRNKI